MSLYPAIADATLTLLRSYQSGAVYGVNNSGHYDWSVRNGDREHSAVVGMWQRSQFGDTLNGRAAFGKRQEMHYPRISLLVAIGQAENGDDAAVIAAIDRASDVIVYLNRYQRLNNATNVKRAEVVGMGVPELIGSPRSERVTHARVDVDLQVLCEITLDVVEGAQ